MFQFMGGDMVLMTAAEAKFPRRDLPKAARFMYLLPVGFYLVAIILVGLNINYLDPRLDHPHVPGGLLTARRSPFVLPIIDAGIPGLPGFFNACFIFSALTAS
jgi:yeast amino acid transporter